VGLERIRTAIATDLHNDIGASLSRIEGSNHCRPLSAHTDGSPAVRLGYGNRPSLSPDTEWVATVRREGIRAVEKPPAGGRRPRQGSNNYRSAAR